MTNQDKKSKVAPGTIIAVSPLSLADDDDDNDDEDNDDNNNDDDEKFMTRTTTASGIIITTDIFIDVVKKYQTHLTVAKSEQASKRLEKTACTGETSSGR